jgi:hypothetical protein
MKIRITTEREILDKEYWLWINGLKEIGIPIDGNKLKEKGVWGYEDDLGHTKAKTEYRIVK